MFIGPADVIFEFGGSTTKFEVDLPATMGNHGAKDVECNSTVSTCDDESRALEMYSVTKDREVASKKSHLEVDLLEPET